MANFISSNSGAAKMEAMQEALANSTKPVKVKIKVKIKTDGKNNEKLAGNTKRTDQKDR